MYLLSNFITQPTSTEISIRVRDDQSFVQRTILANTVASILVDGSYLIVTFKGSTISFNMLFSSNIEASQAMVKLQGAVLKINENAKNVIPSVPVQSTDPVLSIGNIRYTDLRTESNSLAIYSEISQDYPLAYIQPDKIVSITRDDNRLLLTDSAIGIIELFFSSTFDCSQGLSRIKWLKNDLTRTLSISYPPADIIPPYAIYTSNKTSNALQYITLADTSNRTDMINYFLVSIVDARDGVIPMTDSDTIIILDENSNQISSITSVSNLIYTFYINAYDTAGNSFQTSFNFKVVSVLPDFIPPYFVYRAGLSSPKELTGPIGSVPFSYYTPVIGMPWDFNSNPIMTTPDIVQFINSDVVYTTIDPPAINIGGITSGDVTIQGPNSLLPTTGISFITGPGTYLVTMTKSDLANNITTSNIYIIL